MDSVEQFHLRPELSNLNVADLLQMDEQAFLDRFQGTPLERTGRAAIFRNAIICAVNGRMHSVLPELNQLRNDASEIVSDTADWAVSVLT